MWIVLGTSQTCIDAGTIDPYKLIEYCDDGVVLPASNMAVCNNHKIMLREAIADGRLRLDNCWHLRLENSANGVLSGNRNADGTRKVTFAINESRLVFLSALDVNDNYFVLALDLYWKAYR